MKTVCETLGVARSNIAARAAGSPSRARGRPPLPDRELVEDIKAVIAEYAHLRLSACPCHPASECPETGAFVAQCQARLPGDEAAQSAIGAPHRSGR